MEGSYELRQGFENVVDNGETADYRILGEFAMYRNRTLRLAAGGMVTWNRPQTDYTLAPSVGYFRTSADYPYPKREIALSTADAGCDLHLTRHGQRGTLRATVGGRYAVNLTRHTLLTDSRLDPDIGAMLFDSVDRMTADVVELTAACAPNGSCAVAGALRRRLVAPGHLHGRRACPLGHDRLRNLFLKRYLCLISNTVKR